MLSGLARPDVLLVMGLLEIAIDSETATAWAKRSVTLVKASVTVRVPARGPEAIAVAWASALACATAWPTKPARELGYKFRGYRLSDDQRPTFLYSFNEINIEDFPNAIETKANPAIRRSFTLTTDIPIGNLYYRAAVADKIEAEARGGWHQINDWRMRIESDARPVVRRSGKKMELLVPIRFTGNRAKFMQKYAW